MKSDSKPYSQFARALSRLRGKKGFTQEKLAEKSGISYRYYQSLEAGVYNPTLTTLLRLKKALGCSWDDLLQGAEKLI